MKFYVIENSKIPKMLSLFIDVWAITLYPFIICKGKMNQQTRTHEIIHLHQQRELLVIGFYVLYVLFWLRHLIQHRSLVMAYACIPFEREAYDNDTEFTYPLNRKRFSWVKYLRL